MAQPSLELFTDGTDSESPNIITRWILLYYIIKPESLVKKAQQLIFIKFVTSNIDSGHNQLIRSQLIIPIVSAVFLENVKTLNKNVIITLFRWFIVRRIKTLFRFRRSLFQHLESVVLMKIVVNKCVKKYLFVHLNEATILTIFKHLINLIFCFLLENTPKNYNHKMNKTYRYISI